ncbi:MAG: hypothetical protein R3B09_14355 [Nannocystaceae bacterium]
MRPSILASLTLLTPIAACSSDPIEASATATDTDTSSGTGTETGTTSSGSTSSGSGSTSTGTGTSTGGACTPGMSVSCACPDGGTATQTCEPDGMSFGPCECPMTSTSSTTDMTTSTTDASTTDATTSTTDATTDATTGGAACAMTYQIELMPADATLSGGWMLGMSMIGEGEIANNPMSQEGSILYEPEIPCDDTWTIWARVLDNGQDDSYFARLDGAPDPAAIFEGDCTGQGNGYKWARLNWRDPMANPCEYLMDPWAPTWSAGVHEIEFLFRESTAMGRILLTNDPDFVPM